MEIEGFSSYGMGYLARQQGIPKEKNPLPSVGEMHKRWMMGWEHAEEEIQKKVSPVGAITKTIPIKLVK